MVRNQGDTVQRFARRSNFIGFHYWFKLWEEILGHR
jgi:hypothetical protein